MSAAGANTFSVGNQTTTFSGTSGSSLGTFGYDSNGNPTTYKGNTLTFDPENRMTGYGSALTSGYGPDDLRAWKHGSGGTTYFLYTSLNQPVCEFNASGTLTATNTYGHVGLVSRRVSSTSTFYTFDPQGSVAQRLNASGGIVSSDTGDAFGSRATTGSGDVFGYIGQWGYYSDSETGLYLCQHRYYDPAIGRFTTRDPMGYGGGINLYDYVHNNSISLFDANGFGANLGACIAGSVESIISGLTSGSSAGQITCSTAVACAAAAAATFVGALLADVPFVNGCVGGGIGGVINYYGNKACDGLCKCPDNPTCDNAALITSIVAGCLAGVGGFFIGNGADTETLQTLGGLAGVDGDLIGALGGVICEHWK